MHLGGRVLEVLRDRVRLLRDGQDVRAEPLHGVADPVEGTAQAIGHHGDRAEEPDEHDRDDDRHEPFHRPQPTRLHARHDLRGVERGEGHGGEDHQLVSSSALRPITRLTGTVKTIPCPGRSRFPQISWMSATARSAFSSSTTLNTV